MNDGLGRAAARGATVTLGSQGARFVLQMTTLAVLARLLTPRDFGLVAMVTAITNLAEIVRDLGLSSAALQARTISDDERSNLFWVNLAVGVTLSVVAIGCAPLVAKLYDEPVVAPIMVALAGLFLVSGANTQFRAELGRTLRFRTLAVSDIVAQVAAATVSITAAALGARYWSIVLQQATLVVITMLLNVLACTWRPGWPRRGAPITRFLRFGGNVLATQSMSYVTDNVGAVALGAYSGPNAVGLYSRAYQLLMVPVNQIVAPMTRTVLPVLSRVTDDVARYERFVGRTQLVGCYVLGIPLAIAAGAATPVVAILFGDGWEEVAPIFAVLAAGGVLRSIGVVAYWIYLSNGVPHAQLRLYLVLRPVMIAMIIIGVPWGPIGVATGYSMAFAVYWVASVRHACRTVGLPSWPLFAAALRSIALVSVPAGLLAFAGTLLVDGPLAELALAIGLSALYLGVIFTVVPVERRDLAEFRATVAGRRGAGAPGSISDSDGGEPGTPGTPIPTPPASSPPH